MKSITADTLEKAYEKQKAYELFKRTPKQKLAEFSDFGIMIRNTVSQYEGHKRLLTNIVIYTYDNYFYGLCTVVCTDWTSMSKDTKQTTKTFRFSLQEIEELFGISIADIIPEGYMEGLMKTFFLVHSFPFSDYLDFLKDFKKD